MKRSLGQMSPLSRRALMLLPFGAAATVLLPGCLIVARLLVGRGLARGLVRAGALMEAEAAGAAASVAAARMATFGRAASIGFTPAAARTLVRQQSIAVLETGGRKLGRIDAGDRVITLRNSSGQRIVRSELINRNIIHYDDFGNSLGYSTSKMNGSRFSHRSANGKNLGYDEVMGEEVKHYDKNGSYMGTSRLNISPFDNTPEVLATAGLGELILAYSASIIYSEDKINDIYKEIRSTQEKCFKYNDERACSNLKFLNGQLETALRSKNKSG